ncbi:MAG: hypothetical protein JNK99_07015 [Candidatus Accumulibacter sp.]|uniref:hypothetical protein n=1 Tax=Accumulibacter sp. TaxID=2053492 RepID=UPI001A400D8E|nr:hypothetical protein [Accumulibacter sp.]MBL8394492.1 hypothetical protein [Accumulibacter sp.]
MQRPPLLPLLLLLLAGTAVADPEAALTVIGDLGWLNGQALACGQMASSGQAKALMIRHAPKTRRYGEAFEQQTSDAFLVQGQEPDRCPAPDAFAARLSELSARLQAVLPAVQPAGRQ